MLEMQHFEPSITKLAPVKADAPIRQIEINKSNQGILSGGKYNAFYLL